MGKTGKTVAGAGLVKLAVATAALLAWMAFIFYMSAKTGGASGGMSESVAAWLAQVFCPEWASMPADARAELLARMSLPVRKGAHITEYAILAALAFTAFSQARAVWCAGAKARGAVGVSGAAGGGAGAPAGENAGTGADAGDGARRVVLLTALAAFAFSVLYAAGDEFHQLFVPGRAGLPTDVAIDSCGAALGSALAALVAWRRRAAKKGRAFMRGSRRMLVLIVLHMMLAIWSCTDVLSKYAAGEDFPSIGFFIMWAGVLALMGVYALGWQQVIRRMPLATAFANKAITIVWGLFWGVALFSEALTPGKIVGAVLVVAGIVLFVFSDGGGGASRVLDEKDAASRASSDGRGGNPRTPSDEGDGA